MFGTLIAICFSYTAYRMARQTGRSVVLWIAMVWALGTVCAMLFGTAGFMVDFFAASDEDVESGNVNPYIAFWAAGAGTIVGSGIATLLAGRPINKPQVVDAEIVA